MMEVRNWIQELQRTAQIDPVTGFIAGMERFLPATIEQADQVEMSRNIANEIKPMIDKILTALQTKLSRTAMAGTKVDVLMRESIFKIACRLIEKMLVREL